MKALPACARLLRRQSCQQRPAAGAQASSSLLQSALIARAGAKRIAALLWNIQIPGSFEPFSMLGEAVFLFDLSFCVIRVTFIIATGKSLASI